MLVNADITLYNACFDPLTRLDVWKRTVIRGVWFYVDNRVNATADGLTSADAYKVRIPIDADTGGAVYIPPETYSGEQGTWTLKTDDYVVRGVLEREIERPAELMKEKRQAFKITSWSDNRFGGLPHWRVGGV